MTFHPELNPYVQKIANHSQIPSAFQEIKHHFTNKISLLDLGCGSGHFLQESMARHPTWRGLGVERRYKRIFKTAEKLKEASAWVIQADIDTFIKTLPSQLWNEVWIQFPDPWPKLRHEKNRLIKPELFYEIFRILKPSGRFCFRSDCRLYWELLQMFNLQSYLFPVVKVLMGDLYTEEPKTLYQQKFTAQNIPIYSLEMKKMAIDPTPQIK